MSYDADGTFGVEVGVAKRVEEDRGVRAPRFVKPLGIVRVGVVMDFDVVLEDEFHLLLNSFEWRS